METKRCTTCDREKPLTAFWKDRKRPDGRYYECKPCGRVRNNGWYRTNAKNIRHRTLKAVHRHRLRKGWLASVLTSAKHRAKLRGMEFDIAAEDIAVPEFCPVLGVRLVSNYGRGWSSHDRVDKDFGPSLDRIDNTKGYVQGNVIVVSYRANRLKSDSTPDELSRIAEFYRALQNGEQRG